jgi:hypothetical protein
MTTKSNLFVRLDFSFFVVCACCASSSLLQRASEQRARLTSSTVSFFSEFSHGKVPLSVARQPCCKQWAQRMAAAGKLLAGEKLADEGGKIISKRGASIHVMDGPFAEAKEVLGGFFMIEAFDYVEAVEVAKACPHVQYGAATHVRLIEET